jgi:hypothetical protein
VLKRFANFFRTENINATAEGKESKFFKRRRLLCGDSCLGGTKSFFSFSRLWRYAPTAGAARPPSAEWWFSNFQNLLAQAEACYSMSKLMP